MPAHLPGLMVEYNYLCGCGDDEVEEKKHTPHSNSNKLISAPRQQPWTHTKSQHILQCWDRCLAAVQDREEFENLETIVFSQSREEMASLLLHPAAARCSAPSISDFKLGKQLCRRRAALTGHLMNWPSGWLMVKRERSGKSYATLCQHQAVSSYAWLNKRGNVQWVPMTWPVFPFYLVFFFSHTTMEGREQSQVASKRLQMLLKHKYNQHISIILCYPYSVDQTHNTHTHTHLTATNHSAN